jgi:hypothetical protein
VNWLPNADGNWTVAANWSSDPALPNASDEVVIDVGGSTVRTVTIDSGTQTIGSLLSEENIHITGGNLVVGGGDVYGDLFFGPTRSLTVNGGIFSAHGAAAVDTSNLFANAGGSLRLPNATSYAGMLSVSNAIHAGGPSSLIDLTGMASFAGSPAYGRVLVAASGGGEVDLSNLLSVHGITTFQSSGTGSRVKLTSVQAIDGHEGDDGVQLILAGNGAIDVPAVQTLKCVSATVSDGLTLDLSSATSYSGAGSVSNTMNATGLGSRIDLSGLTSFAGAPEYGRVFVDASNGGEVDLSNVETIRGITTLRASGAGSHIKLTEVTAVDGHEGSDGVVFDLSAGGMIDIPAVQSLKCVGATVSGGLTLDLSSATSYVGADYLSFSLQANGANSLLDLSGLASVDGRSHGRVTFTAAAGGVVDLSNVATFNGTATLAATGLDSEIKLTNLQSIDGRSNNDGVLLNVHSGGLINLPAVQTLMGVSANVNDGMTLDLSSATSYSGWEYLTHTLHANGTGSRIDLSGLTAFTGSRVVGRVTVTATGGGEVDLSNVTSINQVATFSASGTGSRVRLTHVSTIDGTGGGHPTDNVTLDLGAGGAIELPIVQSLKAVSAVVRDGMTLDLSSATSYTGIGYISNELRAEGAGSRIDLTGLNSFGGVPVAGQILVAAAEGAEIDLSNLTAINGTATFRSTRSGSRIRLDKVEAIDGLSQPTSAGVALNPIDGGAIDLPVATSLTNVNVNLGVGGSIDLPAVATLVGVGATVGAGQTLDLSAATSYAGISYLMHTLQASGAESQIDLTGLANFSGPLVAGQAFVVAANGGEVKFSGGTTALSGQVALEAVTGSISFGAFAIDSLGSVYAIGTLAGDINNSGAFTIPNDSAFTAAGKFVNAGTMKIGANSTFHAPINLVQVPGGQLRGTGTLHGNLENGGRLAPGNSPGILSIQGDFAQSSSGTLEIEVGGLTAGTLHDRVVVTGSATIAGRLEVPVVNVPNNPPYIPQLNDEIVFLTTAGGVTGQFDSLAAPGLKNVSDLAIKVFRSTDAKDLHLKFVNKADVVFTDTQDADWENNISWSTMVVPDTENFVTIQNNAIGGNQRVDVQSANAFTDELIVADSDASIIVGVHDGLSLSAVSSSVTIGSNATIELGVGPGSEGGTLSGLDVILQDGGALVGNGSVITDDLVVTTGTLSPGFSVGQLHVTGDVQLSQQSTVVADIDGAAGVDHDTLDVTGEVQLGGKLQAVIAPTAALAAGDTFTLLTAQGLAPGSRFHSVETLGSDNLFIVIEYPHIGMGTGAAVGEYSINGRVYERGDMNHDESVDSADIPYFAVALGDAERYFNTTLPNGACICDFGQAAGDLGGPEGHPDGALTFDDIAAFATKLGMSQGAFLAAMSVPEPASAVLLMAALTPVLGRCRRISRCHVAVCDNARQDWIEAFTRG